MVENNVVYAKDLAADLVMIDPGRSSLTNVLKKAYVALFLLLMQLTNDATGCKMMNPCKLTMMMN